MGMAEAEKPFVSGRLIGYARLSKEKKRKGADADADRRDTSIEAQIEALRAAGCETVFSETLSSDPTRRKKATAGNQHGPEMLKALAALQPGDYLVTVALDRVGRTIRVIVNTVEELADRGVWYRSLTQPIDTGAPDKGKVTLAVFAALAEGERDSIRARTRAALAAIQRSGRKLGRPSPLAQPHERARVIAYVQSNPTMPVRQVAKVLGYSVATLYQHLPELKTIHVADKDAA